MARAEATGARAADIPALRAPSYAGEISIENGGPAADIRAMAERARAAA